MSNIILYNSGFYFVTQICLSIHISVSYWFDYIGFIECLIYDEASHAPLLLLPYPSAFLFYSFLFPCIYSPIFEFFAGSHMMFFFLYIGHLVTGELNLATRDLSWIHLHLGRNSHKLGAIYLVPQAFHVCCLPQHWARC